MKELDKAIKRESDYIIENEESLKHELGSAYNFVSDLNLEHWTYGKRLYQELETEYNGGHTRRALIDKLGYIDVLERLDSQVKQKAIDSFIVWVSALNNKTPLNHFTERESAKTKFRLLIHPSVLVAPSIYYRNRETDYLQWISENPEGFVLNMKPSRTSKYYVLHNPKCTHITGTKQPLGAFAERDYCKLCSNDLNEIEAWLYKNKTNYEGELQICKSCNPLEAKERTATNFLYPEIETESEPYDEHWEGAKSTITINRYERDPKARQKCLDHHGYQCQVCDFNFEDYYGLIGTDFIHVHHLVPISERGESYKLDPINDLAPVCPNCHAMLHRRPQPYSINEMREIINHSKK